MMATPFIQHPLMAYTFVGCDSHKHSHTLVFVDCFARELGTMTISNIPSDFEIFLEKAQEYLIEGTCFCFGLEDTTHYGRALTSFLLGKGQMVKNVSSNLVASERNAKNTLNKSDYIDALSCVRVLISRFDTLPLARVSDELFILRSLVSRRKAIVKLNISLKRQLHELLTVNYPTYQTFFHDIACKSALVFFSAYPSPSCLNATNVEALEILLYEAAHKSINKEVAHQKAKHIFNSVTHEKVPVLALTKHRDFTISSIIKQIETNLDEIDTIESHLEQLLDILDIPLTSMKGIDVPIACGLINNIGDINRFKNAAALAKYAGIAPSMYASGKSHNEYSNTRGNRELATLFYQLSVTVALLNGKDKNITNPFFHELYVRKRAEGKTHKQALKVVQRRLVNVIFGIMKYKHDYINPPTMYVDERTGIIKEAKIQSNPIKIAATFELSS